MKKLLIILSLLTACAMNTTDTTTHTTHTKHPINENEIMTYEYNITAFACDNVKQSDITFCDIDGEKLTGVVEFENGSYIYYEDGDEVDGVVIYPNKEIKNYYKHHKGNKSFTKVNYYDDGSIESIQKQDSHGGSYTANYSKGKRFDLKKDQKEIDKFGIIIQSEQS